MTTKHDPSPTGLADYTTHKRHQPLYNTNAAAPAPTYGHHTETYIVEYDQDVYDLVEEIAQVLYCKMSLKLTDLGVEKEDAIAACHAQAFSALSRGKWKRQSSLRTFVYSCLLNVFRSLLSAGRKKRERDIEVLSTNKRDTRLDSWIDRRVNIEYDIINTEHGVLVLLAARKHFSRDEWRAVRLRVQKHTYCDRMLFQRFLDIVTTLSKELGEPNNTESGDEYEETETIETQADL